MNLTYANNLIVRRLRDAADPRLKHLVDLADLLDDEPSDTELVDALVEAFGMSRAEVINRLAYVDIAALREVVA